MLEFDDGFYSISTCPYPNEAFLGGRGEPGRPIYEDFLPKERQLPNKLRYLMDMCEERLKQHPQSGKEQKRNMRLHAKARKYPPDGNIWQIIAKYGWRRRGWLPHAYPALGKGSVVPTDWCGFGCTLMNEEALSRIDFSGYRGGGTEDLYVIWHNWYPANLRINCIMHCPADHIIWDKKKGKDTNQYHHFQTSHHTTGEYVGHLVINKVPWDVT